MKISTALINRKQIIVLAVFMAIGTAAKSQLSIGLHATGNLSSAKTTVSDFPGEIRKTAKILPGAGVLLEYAAGTHFSIQTGADYRKNGVTLKFELPVETEVFNVNMTTDLNYIQVPLNFLYKTNTNPVRFYAGAGPYVGIGISGKNKIKMSAPDGQVVLEEETEAFKKEEDGGAGMKRFDFGGQALAGIKAGKYYATISYQLGFANIGKNDENSDKYNNQGFQLTLGYIIR
jgi:hypothetical protein